MRNTFAFVEWYFRSCDLDLAVNLHRIAVDYFAIEPQRNFDPESTFAGCGGSDDGDDWGL